MRIVSLLILAVLGCDGGSEEPVRSRPVPPTVELGNPDGMGVKWSTLDGFVTTDAPAVPEALGGLRIGQSEADARQILDTIHDARVPPPKPVEIDGYRVWGAALAEYDDLGVSAIVDARTGTLDQIDLGLSSDQALYVFTDRWGPPTMETHPKLGPLAVWTNRETGLRVELSQTSDGQGVAKFRMPTTE